MLPINVALGAETCSADAPDRCTCDCRFRTELAKRPNYLTYSHEHERRCPRPTLWRARDRNARGRRMFWLRSDPIDDGWNVLLQKPLTTPTEPVG